MVSLAVLACASAPRPFALQPPFVRDTDLRPVNVPCRSEPTEKDAQHVSCAPRLYVSPLGWDGIDNALFRPLSDAFGVKTVHEARDVNSMDEVPDSAWFTNRLGAHEFSLEDLKHGACVPEQELEPAHVEPGSWLIDRGKANGASLGFRVVLPGKRKYLIKIDAATQPELATAASVIGAASYNAVGFYTSCEQVIYVDPAAFKLAPGLTYEDNSGQIRAFDEKALARVFAEASKRDGRVRLQASAWLPGYLLGPFSYVGTRDDDPNDAIPHEERRELRGGKLLAAWLNHFDAREQNTMDSWIIAGRSAPDSSPGYVRHYYLDTSDCLGSEWAWDGLSRRLGRSYLLDWGDIATDFVTLGVRTRSWETVDRVPGHERFGYFDVATFEPEHWKTEYPNAAFTSMTERDGAWMARILARFTPEMVRELAAMGQFSNPSDTRYIGDVLEARLGRILERYLTRLSPLGDVHVENAAELCMLDLARWRNVREPMAFHYGAHASSGERLDVRSSADGRVCVRLPPPGSGPDASPRRLVVSIVNGVAPGALRAHLYALGVGRGYELVGVERPERN
jgi:hypothetical protein